MAYGTRAKLLISDAERAQLQSWARQRKASYALVQRSGIILDCASGTPCRIVAVKHGVTPQTVTKWCRRFAAQGLKGLLDAPRSGGPRTIGQTTVESVVLCTLKEAPPNATHWTTRALARRLGMSQSAISRIWRRFGIQPQRQGDFRLSSDSSFVARTRDIVGLSLGASVKALALCVEQRPYEGLPAALGRRPDGGNGQDSALHAATALIASLDALDQTVKPPSRGGGSREFLAFLRNLERNVPAEHEIHVILDKAGPEHKPSVALWLVRHRRFRVHVTPSPAAWRNEVRFWTLSLADRQGQRISAVSARQMKEALHHHQAQAEESPPSFAWLKSTDDVRIALSSHLM